MAKWILCIFAVLLTGCTNHLLIRDSREYRGDYQAVARSIHQIARTCWQQQETLLKAQILVESVVTVDSIMVSARFDSFGSGVQNPFIRFVIKPDGNSNAKIDFYFQEIGWMGKERHLTDAYNWLSGNYICSQ
jgi:hypothetical protein